MDKALWRAICVSLTVTVFLFIPLSAFSQGNALVEYDLNQNKLSDELDEYIQRHKRMIGSMETSPDEKREALDSLRANYPRSLHILFKSPSTNNQRRLLERAGARIDYEYKAVLFGFVASLPANKINQCPDLLGKDLLLIIPKTEGSDWCQLDQRISEVDDPAGIESMLPESFWRAAMSHALTVRGKLPKQIRANPRHDESEDTQTVVTITSKPDVPTIEASQGLAKPIALPSCPQTPMMADLQIDGRATGMGNMIANHSNSVWPPLRLYGLRMAHDNDYLYLHLAASAPPLNNPPSAFWIFIDSISYEGMSMLTDNNSVGPEATLRMTAGTSLEHFLRADYLLAVESKPQRALFDVWLVDYNEQDAKHWGEIVAGPPSKFLSSSEAPIGADAAFLNASSFMTANTQSTAGETGLEFRIPLSALGIAAPLTPRFNPTELRIMAAAGRTDTGEWSNQVVGDVGINQPLSGGFDSPRPDFTANAARVDEQIITFDGIQTISYPLSYVPFPGNE